MQRTWLSYDLIVVFFSPFALQDVRKLSKSCLKVEKNVNYSLFLIKRVECELCREKFPDFVKHNDKLYEILDFKSEFKNYLTIECLTLDKNNNRCLYVVNLENNHKLKISKERP